MVHSSNDGNAYTGIVHNPHQVSAYFNQLPIAVAVLLGASQVFDYVNDAYCQLIGRTAREVLGKPLFSVFPELKGTPIDTIHQRVLDTGIAEQLEENPVSYLQGGKLYHGYFNTRFQPLQHPDGTVYGLMVSGFDVTETVALRRQNEEKQEKLHKAKEQLEAGINTGKVGIWHWDALTDSLTWSAEQYELFGISTQTPVQYIADFHRFVHPHDREQMYESVVPPADGQHQYEYKFRITRADGAVRWLQARSRTHYNEQGQLSYITGVNIDITDQELMHLQLEASERRFRSLADNSPDVITRHGRDHCYLYISPKIVSYTGIPASAYIGKTVQQMGFPDYLCAVFDEALAFVFRERKPHQVSYKMPGEGPYVFSRMNPEFDVNGEVESVLIISTDVTEIKHAEAIQRKLATQLQLATNSARVGTWWYHPASGRMEWSALHRRMWGYAETETPLAYPDWERAVVPADLPGILAALERARTAQQTYDATYRIVGVGDGQKRWVRSVGRYQYDASGEAVAVTGITIDITEQKLAELHLREKEEHFSLALAGGDLGTYDFYPRQNKVVWSEKTYALFGWVPESPLTYECFSSGIHPHDRQRVHEAVLDAMKPGQDGYFDEEYRVINRADGKTRWVRSKGRVLFDDYGEAYRFIGVVQEISRYKEIQDELQAKEQQLRILADFLPQIIWTTNADGNVVYINKRWTDYTGESNEVTEFDRWLTVVHPDDQEEVCQTWKACVQTGSYYEKEYRIRNKDGVYRWFLTRALPLQDDAGLVMQWFGSSTDIHDGKTMATQLEALVQERTRALQRSNEDLQQFAHVASHDLREPVRKVKTFASALEVELGENASAKAQLYLSKVNSAANRMFAMINGVLHYSALNALATRMETVDLNHTLAQIIEDLEVPIREQKAHIVCGDLPMVAGMPVLLYQLFYNLLNNALKFSRSEVPLLVRIVAHTRAGTDKPLHCIAVSDNGIGFNPRFSDHIFSTFTRLHSKDAYEGTGLGLALCKKIVERHGGSIEAEGVEGEGARFIVCLPAHG